MSKRASQKQPEGSVALSMDAVEKLASLDRLSKSELSNLSGYTVERRSTWLCVQYEEHGANACTCAHESVRELDHTICQLGRGREGAASASPVSSITLKP
jgi:hypothetical protein